MEDGGLHTVEAFILARYFMFLDVYFHKTRRILDHHLTEFMSAYLECGQYPYDLEAYLAWDDHKAMCLLQAGKGSERADRLLRRGHFRLAFDTPDHPKTQELERFDWLQAEAEREFGGTVVFDEARKAAYAFDQPEVYVRHHKTGLYEPLSEASSLVGSLRKIQKCRVYAAQEVRDEVATFCTRFWSERRQRETERGR